MKIFIFICSSFLPVFMIFYSFIGKNIKRNKLVGFRTRKSLENDVIWEKAQFIFCKLLFISGIILLLTTLPLNVFSIYFSSMDYNIFSIIIIAIQFIVLIIITITTQIKITKKD